MFMGRQKRDTSVDYLIKMFTMKKIMLVIISSLLVISFYSCEPGRVVVSARYNTPVYDRPPRPYGNYVWIEGDWYSNGRGGYDYRRGYWAAPRGHRTWHEGGWVPSRGGYYWRRGRWR